MDYEADGDQENIATSARSDQIVVAAPVPCPAAPARTAAAPRTRSKRARLNQQAPAGRNGRRARTNEPSDGAKASELPPPPPPPEPKVTLAPKLRSKAWDNFTLIEQPDPDQVFAQCKTCKAILRASSKNGTSHLLRHTANVHPHNTHEVNNFF